jgi:type II secretory pathway component GspD/PulD (secretin)
LSLVLGPCYRLALAVLLILAVTTTASAQDTPVRPQRAQSAFMTGIDCYRRADYEGASFYFQQAQLNQSELSSTERADLETWLRQTNTVLKARRTGTTQVRQAEEALQKGRIQEAESLLKAVNANQFLTPGDKTLVQQLNERLRNLKGAPPPVNNQSQAQARTKLKEARTLLTQGNYDGAEKCARDADRLDVRYAASEDTPRKVLDDIDKARRTAPKLNAAKTDSKSLLTAARSALQKGDLDNAEQLAKQAEKARNSIIPDWVHPWSDTPAKVLKEVQAARAKSNNKGPNSTPGTKDNLPPPNVTAKEKGGPKLDNKGPMATKDPAASPPPGPSGSVNVAVNLPGGVKDKTPQPPVQETATTEKARQLLQQGRQAFQNNDLARARSCAEQAQALRPNLNWWEDNPNKLLADIQRRTAVAQAPAGDPKTPEKSTNPRTLLREARALYNAGKLDDADKMCLQARSAPGVRWGLFEDTPDRLKNDIQKTRQRRDQEESVRVLADARKLYAQGDFKEARSKAYQAAQLHGPYSIWDMSDRPQKLLAEIDTAEARQRQRKLPDAPIDIAKNDKKDKKDGVVPPNPVWPKADNVQLAKNTEKGPQPPEPPSQKKVVLDLNKQKALMLVQEARALQKQGRLLEARQKALQAQAMRVKFDDTAEDSPELVLLNLSDLCAHRIAQLLDHVTECVTTKSADPQRFQKAEADLATARQLTVGFGLDVKRVETRSAWVQQQKTLAMSGPPKNDIQVTAAKGTEPGGTPPEVNPKGKTPDPVTAMQKQGMTLLEQSRRELKAGQTVVARRLAEEAYTKEAYGVRDEAAMVLRQIDIEEFNQMTLAANRAADAGFEAYRQKDFLQAAAIFGAIDTKLLWPAKQGKLKEIMMTPEMQPSHLALLKSNNKQLPTPGGLVQVSEKGVSAPGKANASDTPGALAAGEGFADKIKGMEEVLFQKLRDEGLVVQRSAMQRFSAGDITMAMDLLRDYNERLNDAQLDPQRLALLRRPIEDRLSKFRTLKAQHELETAQQNYRDGASKLVSQRAVQKQQRQQKVAELMKQYHAFDKEGKYKEAGLAAAKILEIDPENQAAIAGKAISEVRWRQQQNDRQSAENEYFGWQGLHDAESLGKYADPLYVDRERSKVAGKRGDGGKGYWPATKDPLERAIERKLSHPITDVNFKDVHLKEALEVLENMSGIGMYFDNLALQDAGISLDQPLTVRLQQGISVKSALNILLGQARLTYVPENQMLKITTQENANGKLRRVIYPVADLVVPVDNHTLPMSADFMQQMDKAVRDAGKVNIPGTQPFSPSGGLHNGVPASNPNSGLVSGSGKTPVSVSMAGPGQTIEDVLIRLITTSVAPESWSDVGGKGTVQYFPLGLALVVNQTPDIQEQIVELLQQLRKLQDLEVAVEMRVVSVGDAFYEFIGLDFNINITNHSTRYEPQLITQNFTPNGFLNGFDPSRFVSGLTPAKTLTPDLNIPITNSSFGLAYPPPFGGIPGALGADGGLSLGLAFLSDIQVFMFMEAAQGDRRANIMQAPKLTMFNGQSASISVNDFIYFTTSVQPTIVGNQTVFIPSTTPLPVGFGLNVQPVVSADRRFVRMNLNPTITNLISTTISQISIPTLIPSIFDIQGGGLVMGQPSQVINLTLQMPEFASISVMTTVVVPDGGTVVLGGLKVLAESREEFGPPILSKIPYINRLFKNVSYGRQTQHLLILVTPRIIINEEEEQIALGQLPPLPR